MKARKDFTLTREEADEEPGELEKVPRLVNHMGCVSQSKTMWSEPCSHRFIQKSRRLCCVIPEGYPEFLLGRHPNDGVETILSSVEEARFLANCQLRTTAVD
ncbi:MAG: hypothetical protein QXL15_01030 [Candidatus Korarchaeota archaeon]